MVKGKTDHNMEKEALPLGRLTSKTARNSVREELMQVRSMFHPQGMSRRNPLRHQTKTTTVKRRATPSKEKGGAQ